MRQHQIGEGAALGIDAGSAKGLAESSALDVGDGQTSSKDIWFWLCRRLKPLAKVLDLACS
jgi:hypothetical protein